MIIAYDDGVFKWHTIDMPTFEKNNTEICIKLEGKVEKEYRFLEQLGDNRADEFNCFVCYSKSFEKLIIGTNKGVLALLPVKAESNEYENEDDEEQREKTK